MEQKLSKNITYKIASFDESATSVSLHERENIFNIESDGLDKEPVNDNSQQDQNDVDLPLNGEVIVRAEGEAEEGDVARADESSKILQRLFFVNGELNGRCEFYNPDTGDIESIIEYRRDKIHGLFEQFDNGKLISRMRFVDGELDGVCENYSIDDDFLELSANFTGGLLSGPIQIYNDKDSLYMQAGFADNKLHGRMFIFNDDGNKQLEMQFKDNKLDGDMITYTDNEKAINKTEFHDDKIHGDMVTFNENGGISSYQHYYAGKMQGEWKVYFDSGQLMEHGSYNQNKKHGTFTNYHLNGMPSRLTHYDNGSLIDLPMLFNKSGKEMEPDDA